MRHNDKSEVSRTKTKNINKLTMQHHLTAIKGLASTTS